MHTVSVRWLALIPTWKLISFVSPPCSHLCSAIHEISLSSCSLRIISGSRHPLPTNCPTGPRGVVSAAWCHGNSGLTSATPSFLAVLGLQCPSSQPGVGPGVREEKADKALRSGGGRVAASGMLAVVISHLQLVLFVEDLLLRVLAITSYSIPESIQR